MLAVGMITMSATSPPASSTKRRRICGEFSLTFSSSDWNDTSALPGRSP